MTIDLVVNPHAGNRTGADMGEQVRRRLSDRGIDVNTHISAYPGHAVELAAEVSRRMPTPDAVVAVGGDGTLFEVLNGVLQDLFDLRYAPHDGVHSADLGTEAGPSPPAGTPTAPGTPSLPFSIGVVPVGTGNSFVRDVGIASVDDAIAAIVSSNTRPIDIGVAETRGGKYAFVNLLGAGFVSNVAHRAQRYKRWGALSYVIAVFQETVALSVQPITVSIDDRTITDTAIFLEICNSRYTGGAMMMAPDAMIDDGEFDVVLMGGTTRRHLLRLFPKIFSGTHVDDDVIDVFRGAAVTVATDRPWRLTPDGETFGSTPLSVTIRPSAISLCVP